MKDRSIGYPCLDIDYEGRVRFGYEAAVLSDGEGLDGPGFPRDGKDSSGPSRHEKLVEAESDRGGGPSQRRGHGSRCDPEAQDLIVKRESDVREAIVTGKSEAFGEPADVQRGTGHQIQ